MVRIYSCCFIALSAFGVVSVLDLGHSNRYVVVSHYCFNLHFPDDIWYGASLNMLICHFHIFLDKVSVEIFSPFFIRLFSSCWLFRTFCIIWITVFITGVFCKYFLSVCDLSSLDIVFHRADVQLISYIFHKFCLWHCIEKVIPKPRII